MRAQRIPVQEPQVCAQDVDLRLRQRLRRQLRRRELCAGLPWRYVIGGNVTGRAACVDWQAFFSLSLISYTSSAVDGFIHSSFLRVFLEC